MTYSRRAQVITAVIFALSACSGGGGGGIKPPTATMQSKTAPVTLTIEIPTKSSMAKMRPSFVSPNTQSLAAFTYAAGATPPATATATVNVSSTSAGCSLNPAGTAVTCSVTIDLPLGNEELLLDAMSGTNGTGSVLASSTQSIDVTAGMAAISVTLDGTPAIIRLSLSTPVMLLGTAGTTTLDVNAYDASGALIVAPGDFSTPLTISADSSAVTLSATSASSPGTAITVTYAGSTSAPYAIHFTGSGGGIASGLIVGSTLDLDPAQSFAVLSEGGGQNLGVATVATTSFGVEPPLAYVPLSNNISTGYVSGFAVLPNGTFAIDLDSYPSCTLGVWPATSGALPYTPVTYSINETCIVAAEANGDLIAADTGGGSELTEYSSNSTGLTATGRTIALTGSQVPGSPDYPYALAENSAGTIAVIASTVSGPYVLVYSSGASGTATPGTISLNGTNPQYVAIGSDGSIYAALYGASGGYQVNEYNASLSPTITITATPPASDYLTPLGVAVDGAGELLVSQETCVSGGGCTYGVDVYSSGSSALQRTVPLITAASSGNQILGPVVVPTPGIPASSSAVSGDMMGYVASRTWTYSSTSDSTPVYVGLYADPQLVSGNIRLIGFESTSTSTLFETANEIGSVDFTPLNGSYLAAAFTSVSSGVAGISGSVPGTPLFVPSSLSLNQTWNPEQNLTAFNFTGGNANAQVVAVGSVPGITACPAGSSTSGASVQYTLTSLGTNGGSAILSFVPGCGMTALSPVGGGIATLQSVGSMPSLGQLTVPRGQPPMVAALHAVWQRFFNVHPPASPTP